MPEGDDVGRDEEDAGRVAMHLPGEADVGPEARERQADRLTDGGEVVWWRCGVQVDANLVVDAESREGSEQLVGVRLGAGPLANAQPAAIDPDHGVRVRLAPGRSRT